MKFVHHRRTIQMMSLAATIWFPTVIRIRIHWVPIRIRIQHFRLNTDPIWIQGFDDQKIKKICSWKKIRYFFFQIVIYFSLGLHKKNYRRSHQHIKTWNFVTFFYFCGSSGSGSEKLMSNQHRDVFLSPSNWVNDWKCIWSTTLLPERKVSDHHF